MSFEKAQLEEIRNSAAIFIMKNRPPAEIRHLLDLDFYIENQSIILCQLRPNPAEDQSKISTEVAKATYVKSTHSWKIYEKDQYLRWKRSEPMSVVEKLQEFFELVEEDEQGHFICRLVFY